MVVTDDRKLWACGSNSHGQLGLGTKEDVDVLTQVTFPSPARIGQVAGGWDFSLACTESGEIFSWGNNAFSQLGRDPGEKYSALPGRVDLPTDSPAVCVAAGLRHGLALTADGCVYGWGHNKKGQVGHVADDTGKVAKVVPLPVKLNPSTKQKVLQITAAAYHSQVLTDCHDIYLWGCNKFGQLSQDPNGTPQLSQPCCLSRSAFGGHKVKSVTSGWTHSIALTDSGEVYTWGRADYGQLGRSCDRSCDSTPKPVAGLQGGYSVACGSEHNLCLTDARKLLSWGWNEHGICGTGDESNVPLPVQVTVPGKSVVSIGCGAGHSFVLVSR
ncbi:secretion-regulating guanine nucleotide exchange factor-like isoform X2 [Littorina saxatilis]